MQCPKCGNENPDEARVCGSCSSALVKAGGTAEHIAPRRSGLATAAFLLAILGFCTYGVTIIPAIVLGIVAIVVIEKSGGRLTGRGLAVLGIIIPVLVFLAMWLLTLVNVKTRAYRMVCGRNLSEIGKAMQSYAYNNDGQFPRSGGERGQWMAVIPNWTASSRFAAYGLADDGAGGFGSISSCFYLLVKYDHLTPKLFLCKGDSGISVFNPALYGAGDKELVDLWDFGAMPSEHCSYAYHQPFSLYPLDRSSESGMAIAADRNPFMPSPMTDGKDISLFVPDGGREAIKMGNAYQHQNDGQNVLFMDMHVGFEKKPYCGINDDNIYTFRDGGDIRRGSPPVLGSQPMDRADSLLVHDGY